MLWAPDVAMQFLSNNCNCAVTKDLYLFNDQRSKEKYEFNKSTPQEINKKSKQLNETSNYLEVFNENWGFRYEYSIGIAKVISRYKNTLVEKYFYHDIRNGPLEIIE